MDNNTATASIVDVVARQNELLNYRLLQTKNMDWIWQFYFFQSG